ncbi:DUF429 domain-containing protein [Bacillus sp. RO2]|jgi:predicted nuclease with RNAse H fold|uniref:DUF429 domain-containing protein n=1 Tax=Bacillus sp. RO2 TaxID=2723913 RepID=UPI00145CE92A|nr:DUF429 domain-containing protein [Bacillus sp. RO2]NMH74632.1 DUF429 domain-containing protein [Bacillus sp. RO2]
MILIGLDLAGPSNHKDTVLTVFKQNENHLMFQKMISNISDKEILNEIINLSRFDELVIGIDAPLSYQDGGGDRISDKQLRKFIVSIGMKSGSIMPPTYSRMVYLTLRGIKLTREIEKLRTTFPVSIVEVHPGAAMGTRVMEKELEYVLTYKQNPSSRKYLKNWFEQQNVIGLPNGVENESHSIDSCAAALAAWHWADHSLKPQWIFSAQPPLHPYDYCC